MTGVRGSQAILTPLSSLLIEVAHAIKAALQILRPLPQFVTNRLARGIPAPAKMRMGIGVPAAAAIPAIIPAVCLGLHECDLGVNRAARALPLIASSIVMLESELLRVKVEPEFLRRGAGTAKAIAAARAEKRSVFGIATVLINLLLLREHQDQELSPT